MKREGKIYFRSAMCIRMHGLTFRGLKGMPAGIGKGGRVIATEYCNNMQSI